MFTEYYPFLNFIADIFIYLFIGIVGIGYLIYRKELINWTDIRVLTPFFVCYTLLGWVFPVRKVLVYINRDGLSLFDAVTQWSALWSIFGWLFVFGYAIFGVIVSVILFRTRRAMVQSGFSKEQIQQFFRDLKKNVEKPRSGGVTFFKRYDRFISADGNLSVEDVVDHIGKPENSPSAPSSMRAALENMRRFIVPFAIASSVERDGTCWRIRSDYRDLLLRSETSQLAEAMEFEEGGERQFPFLFRFVDITDAAPIPHSILVQFATYLRMTKDHIEKNPDTGAEDQALFYFLFLLALNARYLDCYLGLLIDTVELEAKPKPETFGEWRKVADANLKRHQDEYKQHLRDLAHGAFKELFEERFKRRDIEMLIFSVFAEARAIDAETTRDPVYVPKELAQSIADVFQNNPISDGTVPKGASIH